MTTGIEWTDETWNPLAGCTIKSEGCKNCYAMTMAHRLQAMGLPAYQGTTTRTKGGQTLWTGKVNFSEDALLKPLSWKKPRMIFVNSMSDLFHESVTDEQRDRVFAVMALCPHHTFQVLTKRADRMREYCNDPLTPNRVARAVLDILIAEQVKFDSDAWPVISEGNIDAPSEVCVQWPLPNVWLGVSVENQAAADERLNDLRDTPAAVRWISAEPLIGPLDLDEWMICPNARGGLAMDPTTGAYECCSKCDWTGLLGGIDWVVCGGESGPKARPMHPDWARALRDQCAAAGVPFLFKQWGEWIDFNDAIDAEGIDISNLRTSGDGGKSDIQWLRVGKKAAGRHLDGVLHDAYPAREA